MNNESLLERITHNAEELNAATELTYIKWKKMKKYHNLIKNNKWEWFVLLPPVTGIVSAESAKLRLKSNVNRQQKIKINIT